MEEHSLMVTSGEFIAEQYNYGHTGIQGNALIGEYHFSSSCLASTASLLRGYNLIIAENSARAASS